MINIIFFIEVLSRGGAEKVLRNLVNAMDQRKFRITVQTLYPDEGAKYLMPGIEYTSCYPRRSKINSIRARLESALGLTYSLHVKRDYDIEVAYLECGATKIMSASTNRKAVKLAWVHCDLNKKTTNPRAFVKKTTGVYSKFDKAVCVSDVARDSFRGMFGPMPDAITLHNVIDDSEIRRKSLEETKCLKADRINLLSVGTLYQPKRFDRLLQVHKRLLDDGLPVDVWILGDGPKRTELEDFAKKNGMTEHVHFMGFQENPYPYIQAADLLVCSSEYEGYSTFITEGLILGRPIVTTECSGMQELLGHSEYGLITENSEDGLYAGVKEMLTEPGMLGRYTEQSRCRGKDFRQEKLVRDTEEFLERMLREKQGRSFNKI